MKYDIENKAFIQSTSKWAHSLMKDVKQEQKGVNTKNSKLEGKSPTMKAKPEVPRERTSQGDDRIRNSMDYAM